MEAHSAHSVTYVGRKIAAVKWLPSFADQRSGDRVLATGSYDATDNRLQLWTVSPLSQGASSSGGIPSPTLRTTLSTSASVTQIEALRQNRLLVSSADGSASLYYAEASFDMSSYSLQEINTWEGLHRRGAAGKSCACTTVAGSTDGERVVTGGEDGRLNAFQTGDPVAMWTHGDGTGPAINSVQFADTFCFVSGNGLGQLQLWDTRQNASAAVMTMRDDSDNDMYELHDVCVNPGQPDKVATGGGDGVLSVWDIRHPTFPQTIHEAHTSELWQIKFHPGHSDQHLFTCGEDGRLLHWDTNARRMQRPSSEFMVPEDTNNLAIHNLLSDDSSSLGINTIDCDAELLACGTDNQALMIFAPIVS